MAVQKSKRELGNASVELTNRRMVEKLRDEHDAMLICREKVAQRGLPMQIVDAEYQWDRRKLTFFFKADKRVDFRELTKENFRIFKVGSNRRGISLTLSVSNLDVDGTQGRPSTHYLRTRRAQRTCPGVDTTRGRPRPSQFSFRLSAIRTACCDSTKLSTERRL